MRTVLIAATCIALALCATPAHAKKKRPAPATGTEVNCAFKTYHDALDSVFQRFGEGEMLVTVQVLPAFQPESAIVFKRDTSGLSVVRLTLREKLSRKIGVMQATRQHCLEVASHVEPEVTRVAITAAEAERLWSEFSKIDLESRTCPQKQNGNCAYFLDTTMFVVRTPAGHSLKLTDVGGVEGVTSENPALLAWVEKVLNFVAAASGQEPHTPMRLAAIREDGVDLVVRNMWDYPIAVMTCDSPPRLNGLTYEIQRFDGNSWINLRYLGGIRGDFPFLLPVELQPGESATIPVKFSPRRFGIDSNMTIRIAVRAYRTVPFPSPGLPTGLRISKTLHLASEPFRMRIAK